MKIMQRLLATGMATLLTYLITRWWLGTPWSELTWTWLNQRLGGQRPGLASDIELIAVLACALAVSVGIVMLLVRALRRGGQRGL